MRAFFLLLFSFSTVLSCKERQTESEAVEAISTILVPAFEADSAFSFLKKQVEFGPRIPNTISHKNTGDYLVKTLERFGAIVISQEFDQSTYDNKTIKLRNIIASFFPEKRKRIILAAHWDTRPWADRDKQNPNATFDGANDGASGVAVLLEIARAIHGFINQPEIGIDIILFDGEDWGERDNEQSPTPTGLESWWCLGSQYWAKHKHAPNYSAYYGILLDMVGSKNARFYRENLSLRYAPTIVEKVWNTAERLGYSHIFVKRNQGEVTDDHKFVNEIAKIPMVDIVNFDPSTHSFGTFHHTTDDNLKLISNETLYAVGITLLNVVYNEKQSI